MWLIAYSWRYPRRTEWAPANAVSRTHSPAGWLLETLREEQKLREEAAARKDATFIPTEYVLLGGTLIQDDETVTALEGLL